MVVKTAEEYLDSLKEQKPEIYLFGKKIKNRVDHPLIRRAANVVASNYRFANEARSKDYKDLFLTNSSLTAEEIVRFLKIQKSVEDLRNMVKMMGMLDFHTAPPARHLTTEPLNSLFITTYEIDQKYDTDYHDRFINYVKYLQKNDLFCSVTQTDPKGDRSLRPYQQEDPDLYLRVTEKRSDGIVVRGAKVHVSMASVAHELMVLPCRMMTEKDKDYSVSFIVPVDAEGITIIPRIHVPEDTDEFENPITSKYSSEESLILFDDVFVPRERVFMCGEWDFTLQLIEYEAAHHRASYCAMGSSWLDTLIGLTALIAEYNGVERASHIREKITNLILMRQIIYACGLAAADLGIKTPSGAYVPNPTVANVGKYLVSTTPYEHYELLHECAGGLAITMPSAKDYDNPKIRKFMERYFVGKKGVPTENRLRLFRLINDLTLNEYGSSSLMARLHGGGSPAAEKIMFYRMYDLEASKERVKNILGI